MANPSIDRPGYRRLLRALRGGAAVLLVCVLGAWAWAYRQLPSPPPAPPETPAPASFPEPVAPAAPDWLAVRSTGSSGPVAADGEAASRFRLAGTFFAFGAGDDGSAQRLRKAILDDLAEKQQYLVSEGDTVADYRVWRILPDRVIVTRNGRDEELRLSFLDGGTNQTATAEAEATAEAATPGEPPPLEISRFGKRVGKDRWLLRRDALVDYYQELLDNPERIGKLYETFKPLYNDAGGIEGYRIDVEGEKEFLDAVGIQEGDDIRAVNSLNMTSQSRAEYFIGEFVRGNLNTFVVELERDGKRQKLVYLVR